jgi:hypothetical protein
MSSIEEKVIELIECLYNCKYTRTLSVENKDGLYILKLFLHDPNFGALVISNQCDSEEEFLSYVEEELKKRKLTRSQQYKLIMYGNHESEERF